MSALTIAPGRATLKSEKSSFPSWFNGKAPAAVVVVVPLELVVVVLPGGVNPIPICVPVLLLSAAGVKPKSLIRSRSASRMATSTNTSALP